MSGIDVVVLASGSGSDFQSIVDACEADEIDANVALLITNNPDAYCITRAREHGIQHGVLDHRGLSRREHEKKLEKELDKIDPDLIVLAGFMRIFTDDFVEKYYGKMINIHPALLPLFGGPGMYGEHVHHAVLDSGMKVSGCSVHFVTNEVDMGPIIAQRCVPVKHDDSVDTLAGRVLEEEHKLLPKVVGYFADGRVNLEDGKAWVE